jgi:16S rRNA processing protein RimM
MSLWVHGFFSQTNITRAQGMYSKSTLVEHTDHFKIGFIQRPHGLRGEVTIAIDPSAAVSPEGLSSVFLELRGRLVPYFIESLSLRGDKAFVKFEDVNTTAEAEVLKNVSIYLPKEARPKAGKGEFYFDEIIGFVVTDIQAGHLGRVDRVENVTINPLLLVSMDDREIAIPINAPFITHIDKKAKTISVNLPDGLIDL